MKINKSVLWILLLLVVVTALYRVFPNRPWGFAPLWAMAIFSGAVIKDKKWALALPLLSMLISDILYEILYNAGLSEIKGFYQGQWINYLLFAAVTALGFLMKHINIKNVFIFSLLGPTVYFLLSNFNVWLGGGGLRRPKTWDGLMMCYTDALPFYKNSLIATVIFSALFFGGWYLLRRSANKAITA